MLDGEELVTWLVERDLLPVSTEQEFLVQVRRHLDGEAIAPVRPDVHDALRAHLVVDAIYRSARSSGAPVPLPAVAA